MKSGLLGCAALCAVLYGGPALAGFELPGPGPSANGDPTDQKAWDIVLRAFLGYDDNVNFVSKGDPDYLGGTDSMFAGVTGNLAYRYWTDRPGLKLGAALRVGLTHHFKSQHPEMPDVNDNQDRYDLSVISPTVYVEQDFFLGDTYGKAGASYNLRYEQANIHSIGSVGHSFSLYANLLPQTNLSLGADFTHTYIDFYVGFPDKALNDRDGTHDAISVNGRYHFNHRRQSVGASLGYAWNDAKGRNFDYHGTTVNMDFRTVLFGPVFAVAAYTHGYNDYRGYDDGLGGAWVTPPGRKYQRVDSVSLQIIWTIDLLWTADAQYAHANYGANQSLFAGKESILTIGIQRRI